MKISYLVYFGVMFLALVGAFKWHDRRFIGGALAVLTLVLAMFAPVMGSIL